MRRHPVAVYRVIDEEELLGGEGLEAREGEHRLTPPSESVVRIPRAPRRWRLDGWGSTAVAGAALVAVAALLMSVSAHAPSSAAVPSAAPPLHPAALAPATRVMVASPRRPSPRRPPRRPLRRGARRVPQRGSSRMHGLRAPSVAAHATARATGLTNGPLARPAPFRADQEFGFER